MFDFNKYVDEKLRTRVYNVKLGWDLTISVDLLKLIFNLS